VDPADTKGVRAVQRYFQVDLEMPTPSGLLNVGGRAYVRFDHGREPLAFQWYRSLRQLFLARLNL
jgi:putative peptide zinc metalloprotease protein